MSDHLIIIGGVAAGTKAASKVRREKPDMKITLYTQEKHVSYSSCGLPYYIKDEIKSENRLLVRTPEEFKTKENIDIVLLHCVEKIMPESKKVLVKNLSTGEEFEDEYTTLLLATGANPIMPPIEGSKLNNIFTLKTIEDGVRIKAAMVGLKNAVVVGAGYIGLELVEAFKECGLAVTIVERAQQIISGFDPDLAEHIKTYIEEENGVKVITNDGLASFTGDENGNLREVQTQSGLSIPADIAVVAIGVKPSVELAHEAGIEIGVTGAIKVNRRMQTNMSDIYAAGDCAETYNRMTRKPAWIPLGSIANKMGRVAAINIAGGYAEFNGILGSSVMKVFDYTVARTGLSEKEAKEQGIKYAMAIVTHRDRSGYMQQSRNITLKLLAEEETGRLLGLQAFGKGDADKRVNVVATALTSGMTVDEFIQTDLTYAPPYSSTIDPILIAAQVLEGKIKRDIRGISPQELQKFLEEKQTCCIVDIRGPKEYEKSHLEGAKNVSIEELAEKVKQEKPESIVICCNDGSESYMGSRKLKECGCMNVLFIDGGMDYIRKV